MRSTARTAGSRQQAEDASLPPAVRRNGWLAMRAAAHTRRAASSLSVSHGREGADRGPHHELRVPRPPHEGGQVEWPQAVKAGWRTGHIPNPLGRRAPRRCGRARAAAHARQRHARGRGRAGRLLRRGHRGALPRKPSRPPLPPPPALPLAPAPSPGVPAKGWRSSAGSATRARLVAPPALSVPSSCPAAASLPVGAAAGAPPETPVSCAAPAVCPELPSPPGAATDSAPAELAPPALPAAAACAAAPPPPPAWPCARVATVSCQGFGRNLQVRCQGEALRPQGPAHLRGGARWLRELHCRVSSQVGRRGPRLRRVQQPPAGLAGGTLRAQPEVTAQDGLPTRSWQPSCGAAGLHPACSGFCGTQAGQISPRS